jgi:hypothetical protein
VVPRVALSARGRSGHARDAPINTDFVESGFVHLDRATRTLFEAGMDSCIGVAHASMLGAFQTAGGRREAAKAALRKQQRGTGPSSNGMALDQVYEGAKEAEFEITSFSSPPRRGAERSSGVSSTVTRRCRRNKPRST